MNEFAQQQGQYDPYNVPQEVKKWNWGAFLFGWLWAVFNGVWIGLLGLLPFVGFIMNIILGVKGSEWSWKNKRWHSVQHFRSVQRKWAWWAVGIYAFFIIGFIAMGAAGKDMPNTATTDPQPTATPAATTTATPAAKSADQPKQEDKTITLEKYNKIKPGMSYEQVVKILGFEGTEMSQNQIGGYKTIMYEWQNPDASNMNAIFQNNKLNTKSQFGLQ